MLEALAHNQLKDLLHRSSSKWPHNLTLSRLVARSLRRRDKTLIQLDIASRDFWWIGLLVPICLESKSIVLVLSARHRRRLLNVELPRLKKEGLKLACWEGLSPPAGEHLWLLDHAEVVVALERGFLKTRQLIFIEAELLSERLRDAMSIEITAADWEKLTRAHPSAQSALIQLYERLSRRLFSQATRVDAHIRMDCSEILALKDLIGLFGDSPPPWPAVMNASSESWASWAELDHKTLNWGWHLKPLEPLHSFLDLLSDQPFLLLTASTHNFALLSDLSSLACTIPVKVKLGGGIFQEPIPIFAPRRQPLPNSELYADHLLVQSRRLILGRSGITIVVLDDFQLRRKLTSELAAEFGRRVVHEATSPESNGVVCCRWTWWLKHQDQLPFPEQLIVALLPLASVESPLMAARVEAFKRQGRDWFRELLLPEALSLIPPAIAPIRDSHGRIAILDGRLRSRSWGEQVFHALEPWTPLHRLLPG